MPLIAYAMVKHASENDLNKEQEVLGRTYRLCSLDMTETA
jgi:hypothetical protein